MRTACHAIAQRLRAKSDVALIVVDGTDGISVRDHIEHQACWVLPALYVRWLVNRTARIGVAEKVGHLQSF